MAEVIDLVARLPKRSRSAEIVQIELGQIQKGGDVGALRETLSSLTHDRPVILDLQGAEASPEAIAAIFFFALDHQDRHGLLEVRNVGPDAFSLLEGLGADRMPMVRFTAENSAVRLH